MKHLIEVNICAQQGPYRAKFSVVSILVVSSFLIFSGVAESESQLSLLKTFMTDF